MNRSNTVPIIIGVVVVLAICCVCAGVLVLGGSLAIFRNQIIGGVDQQTPYATVDLTTIPVEKTPPPGEPTSVIPFPGDTTETPPGIQPTLSVSAGDTLKTLNTTNVPVSDPIDLAGRLKGIENIPATQTPPAQPFEVGAKQKFWALNNDNNESFQVNATLQYITPHLYFWVEDGISYNNTDLKTLAETFETKIYPTDREFFGSEWTPGVDDDVHLYILLARNIGQSIAGYYSSIDEYDPKVHPYSNAHEMFDLNGDNIVLSDNFTFGVLAHEFQHMIHWYRDRNEETWMNEGFSEVASFLNGYDVGGFDFAYINDPSIQLNDWPNDPNNPDARTPHYGASFLYLAYFLDRFGEQATKDLVGNPLNGLVSIDDTLNKDGVTDTQTGKVVNADDVFADWVVANYLHDPHVGDGRYAYKRYTNAPQAFDTDTLSRCPASPQNRTVSQYGVEYIRIGCQGNYTLNFTGKTEVGVIPEGAHSGSEFFWSNKGDESDMTLDQTFDFTGKSGPLTLEYWTWYDVEQDYDYVYVEAREEGGKWQILKTPSGTDSNPSGNSYGWGYTGTTQNWIKEQLDLSQYAGKKVDIRFEYVTDAAVNGEGLLLDDISIPEIGYQTDFEADDGGWVGDGFVRITNSLPQTYRVELIIEGGTTTVQNIELNPDQTAAIPLNLTGGANNAILVVSGTARFTRQPAEYTLSITQ